MRKEYPPLKWYFKIFEFLAYYRLQNHDTDERKIHAHLTTVIASSLLMWSYAVLAHLTIQSPIPGIVGYVCSFIHLLSPFLFRFIPGTFFTSSVMIASGMIHQGTFAYFTGGFNSFILIWWSILPMLGGIIDGRRGALFWAFNTVVCASIFLLLELNHFSFPDLISKEGRIIAQAMIVFGYIILSTSLISLHLFMAEMTENVLRTQSKRIDDLFRVLFHDLANPLGRVSMGITIAKRDDKIGNSKGLEIASKATDSMIEMTQNIRKMYTSGGTKEGLSFAPTSLKATVLELIENYSNSITSKQLEIHLPALENDDIFFIVEPISFKNQVLGNILSNAIKFSHPGSRISISAKQVNAKHFSIEIEDQGIGIPPSVLKELFTKSKLKTRPGTMGETGSGYGLHILKSFMDLYDGDVQIESNEASEEQSSGTTFRLILKGYFSAKNENYELN